ncbi:MAG: RluA family pseudouridine synthase [Bacteroidales bacterium]|jgi:23S rRNA pseudouridine1911/1915/1917 synthase|nr:RluA family pseudouridine synthase [Bacteroidales bacterium]
MSETKGQKFTAGHDSFLLEYLYEIFPQQSKKGIKAKLGNGQVMLKNQVTTAFDAPLKKGDELVILPKGISMDKEIREEIKEEARELGIEIIYEDEHLIIVNKEAGLSTIASRTGVKGKAAGPMKNKGEKASLRVQKKEVTVYSILTDYVKTKAKSERKNLKIVNHDTVRIWIVHRLDRDTSGLLVFAKDEKTKELLQSKWKSLVYERKYTAIAEGVPSPEKGRIVSWLKEDPVSLKVWSNPKDNGGQIAITRYETVKQNGSYSMIEFELETGRKNQIRAHASYIGHPIAGDKKYGAKTNPIGRMALHARTLVLQNPYTGETMNFSTQLPAAFKKIKF